MKVKAPFAGHPAASSAWLPAATLSLRGSPESHCNRDTATTGQTIGELFPICSLSFRLKKTKIDP